jgi:hypothetical protein
VYVCICVCVLYMCVCVCCIYMCVYVCVCVCMCVCCINLPPILCGLIPHTKIASMLHYHRLSQTHFSGPCTNATFFKQSPPNRDRGDHDRERGDNNRDRHSRPGRPDRLGREKVRGSKVTNPPPMCVVLILLLY